MRRDPVEIVGYARAAGVPHRLLAPVTAVALVASGGDDHYEMRAGVPGAGHWCGLWGIDADRWPLLADVDLFDPAGAAKACRYLLAAEHGLSWAPAWTTGAALHHRDVCNAAVSMAGTVGRSLATIAGHGSNIHAVLDEAIRKAS